MGNDPLGSVDPLGLTAEEGQQEPKPIGIITGDTETGDLGTNPYANAPVIDPTSLVAAAAGSSGSTASCKPIWTSTKNKSSVQNAYDHWSKHRDEFPEYQNAKQYVDGAHDFLNNSPLGTLSKDRNNGDTLLYDPNTNTFGSKNADGTPRTMFRPNDGPHYWNRQ